MDKRGPGVEGWRMREDQAWTIYVVLYYVYMQQPSMRGCHFTFFVCLYFMRLKFHWMFAGSRLLLSWALCYIKGFLKWNHCYRFDHIICYSSWDESFHILYHILFLLQIIANDVLTLIQMKWCDSLLSLLVWFYCLDLSKQCLQTNSSETTVSE